jgi:hypothetical protein
MKFKQLVSRITKLVENAGEHTFGGGLYIGDPQGKVGQSPLTDKGTFNLALPRQIDAINAMLYTFSSRDYINPDAIVGVVKQKLNMFGLDFAAPKMQIPDGNSTFELVQYGSPQLGVYGQNPYDDVNKKGFKQGDGIKEKIGHSLDLLVNIQRGSNMLRKLTVMIIPADPSSIRDVDNGVNEDCGCNH